ncbi:MAG TPA: hypothetical protein VN709_06745 [Terriglobales bacterium]|nr:hypothetical protein [Terriglobales bacterium]
MKRLACLLLLLAAPVLHAQTYFVTVAGLGGESDYTQRFNANAQALDKLFRQSGPSARVTTLIGADATRAKLSQTLDQIAAAARPDNDFVLILIGHGTFDGVEYKFNLLGPDISAGDLAALCNKIPSRRQLIVDTSSASGGAATALAHPGRGLILATKSGTEKNATVFARYLVAALQDPSADLDKNQAISAEEAFQYAQRHTADFYTSQQRLATEHPISNDDKLLASLTLVRFGAAQQQYADPAKRALLAQKEDLERKIDALNYQRDAMSDSDFKTQVTALLLELTKVQKELDQ